jgi:hypothetical protein
MQKGHERLQISINIRKRLSFALNFSNVVEFGRYITERFLAIMNRLCGIVVRVTGYSSRGPGFNYRPY